MRGSTWRAEANLVMIPSPIWSLHTGQDTASKFLDTDLEVNNF